MIENDKNLKTFLENAKKIIIDNLIKNYAENL